MVNDRTLLVNDRTEYYYLSRSVLFFQFQVILWLMVTLRIILKLTSKTAHYHPSSTSTVIHERSKNYFKRWWTVRVIKGKGLWWAVEDVNGWKAKLAWNENGINVTGKIIISTVIIVHTARFSLFRTKKLEYHWNFF